MEKPKIHFFDNINNIIVIIFTIIPFVIPDVELSTRLMIGAIVILFAILLALARSIYHYRKEVSELFDGYNNIQEKHKDISEKYKFISKDFNSISEKHEAILALFNKKSKQVEIAEEYLSQFIGFYTVLYATSGAEPNPEEQNSYKCLQELHIDAKTKLKGVDING